MGLLCSWMLSASFSVKLESLSGADEAPHNLKVGVAWLACSSGRSHPFDWLRGMDTDIPVCRSTERVCSLSSRSAIRSFRLMSSSWASINSRRSSSFSDWTEKSLDAWSLLYVLACDGRLSCFGGMVRWHWMLSLAIGRRLSIGGMVQSWLLCFYEREDGDWTRRSSRRCFA